ncbi:PepSY domain-containing protein, partial [Acinetobacter baumannii]|nr:PepSY domain-containing protein [Acinetobacter baumannii]
MAWREQAWTLCVLAASCVLLNALTTGDHPLRALIDRKWAVAGVDLMLLALAVLAAWSARKLAASPVRSGV